MTGNEMRRLLIEAMPRIAAARDELRDLDAAIGDGDLGITIGDGAIAVAEALERLPTEALPAEVVRTAGVSLARANPSTFGTLVGSALMAAARELGDAVDPSNVDLLRAAQTGAATIQDRGKAQLGDKTVLDALIPSLAAASSPGEDPLAAALTAARTGVDATRALTSRRGRAAWVGERSVGHPDPGAVAYVRVLEALAGSRLAQGE